MSHIGMITQQPNDYKKMAAPDSKFSDPQFPHYGWWAQACPKDPSKSHRGKPYDLQSWMAK
jgi:hypothetical protein